MKNIGLILTFLLILPMLAMANTQDPPDKKKKKRGQSESSAIRAERSFAINLESGFKNLAGLGVTGSYYANEHIAIDLAAGLGLQFLKFGLRGRYLFLDGNTTPYVGAGFMAAPITIRNIDYSLNSEFYIIDILPSYFAQGVAGLEFTANKGITFGFNVGYSFLLNDNINEYGVEMSDDAQAGLRIIYGSSITGAFNVGYAF